MIGMILHDITRILKIQDEILKEQYVMRGELNAILDMASLGTSFIPSMFSKESVFSKEEKDETTTVEINETKPE
jgi:hypothetical protein